MTVCGGWGVSYVAVLGFSLVARDSPLQVKEEGSFSTPRRIRRGVVSSRDALLPEKAEATLP